jgi:hypothetical protein
MAQDAFTNTGTNNSDWFLCIVPLFGKVCLQLPGILECSGGAMFLSTDGIVLVYNFTVKFTYLLFHGILRVHLTSTDTYFSKFKFLQRALDDKCHIFTNTNKWASNSCSIFYQTV